MSNKNMCTNISNSRVVKNGYLLQLSARTSEVALLTTIVALDLCLVFLSTLAFLALCYLAFFRPKFTSSFSVPPSSFAFRLECLLLPRLGNKDGVLVHPHVLCLKLKMMEISAKVLICLLCVKTSFICPQVGSGHVCIIVVTCCSSERLLPVAFRSQINANIVLRCLVMLCFESITYCSNFKVRAHNLVAEVPP